MQTTFLGLSTIDQDALGSLGLCLSLRQTSTVQPCLLSPRAAPLHTVAATAKEVGHDRDEYTK